MARKGPKEWSPRPDPVEAFQDVAGELIEDLENSGDSQSVAIGDVLASAYNEGDLDEALAVSILDAFIESAKQAKAAIKRLKEREEEEE